MENSIDAASTKQKRHPLGVAFLFGVRRLRESDPRDAGRAWGFGEHRSPPGEWLRACKREDREIPAAPPLQKKYRPMGGIFFCI